MQVFPKRLSFATVDFHSILRGCLFIHSFILETYIAPLQDKLQLLMGYKVPSCKVQLEGAGVAEISNQISALIAVIN